MRFDVDMALAVCGSLAGSEGRRGVATVPVPRLSCPVLSRHRWAAASSYAQHSWYGFCEGGLGWAWTRG